MNLKLVVEAILFSSPDPVSISDLCRITKSSREEVEKAVSELSRSYSERESSIEIIKLGEGYLMRVKPDFYSYISSLSERGLDRGTIRTLAVIAAKQPITLSRLAKIRGNKCYEHVKKLKKLGLISSERKGRSTILKTTEAFLSYFGVDSSSLNDFRILLKEFDGQNEVEKQS
ncbi:MAG: SMC-Scp complex subunit ScpB [Archaeoglobales archaeon]|nr:SMC-Scp complex subunit ScpB [Archaeoglobales archaeon]